jgi:hypothetical protein
VTLALDSARANQFVSNAARERAVDPAPFNQLAPILAKRPVDTLCTDPKKRPAAPGAPPASASASASAPASAANRPAVAATPANQLKPDSAKHLADKAEAEAKAKAAAEAKARADAGAKAKAANHQAAASAKAGGILEYVASSSSASISVLAPASVTQKRLREGDDRGSIPAPAHAPAAQARAPVPDPVPGPAPAPVSDSAPAPSSYAGRATWFTAKFLPKPQPSATVSTVKNRPTVDPAPDNELASSLAPPAKRLNVAATLSPSPQLASCTADSDSTGTTQNAATIVSVRNFVANAFNTKRNDFPDKFNPNLVQLISLLSKTKEDIGLPSFFRCTHSGHVDTYGEVTPALIQSMMQQYRQLVCDAKERTSTFVDLGSGHGGLVSVIASLMKFKVCFGVENERNRASWACPLAEGFLERLRRGSMKYSDIRINFGDFFECPATLDYLKRASLVWVNNVAFTEINFRLLKLLDTTVPIGCVVVSFVSFLPRHDYMNDTGFQSISETDGKFAGWTHTPQTMHVMQKKR